MNHIERVLIIIAGVVLLPLAILVSLWGFGVYLPANSQASKQEFVEIKPGSSVAAIGQTLKDRQLIQSAFMFTLYTRLSGKGDRLIPGTYQLKATLNVPQIVSYLADGKVAARKVVVPEGFTVAKLAKLWVQDGFGSEAEFMAAAAQTYNYDFLPKPNPSVRYQVEGYLFPATYMVNANATADKFIQQMLNAFEQRAWPLLQNATYPAPLASSQDVVTLASMVEKEANDAVNRPKVAGVFLSRLKAGIALQSDVTVDYATGRNVTLPTDIVVKSPYNTYVVKALPAGPICSPGIQALQAVLKPVISDNLFFLAGRDGQVYYAKTLSEHNQNIARYLK